VIVYGAVRDVDALAQLDLGVQALSPMPLKSVRKGVGDVGLTLEIGCVMIANGEYIYADNNGVIVSADALTMPE
jgi:regulator of ribonuclease activity A